MKQKSSVPTANNSFDSTDAVQQPLKSNLKKQPSCDTTAGDVSSSENTDGSLEFPSFSKPLTTANNSREDKKVHFNKFATVQMME